MKGITPVIAIILLMLITISMVGFAFVWFNRVTSEIGGEITTQTQATVAQAQTKVTIDNIDVANDMVYIRNSGSIGIVFSNQIYQTKNSWNICRTDRNDFVLSKSHATSGCMIC